MSDFASQECQKQHTEMTHQGARPHVCIFGRNFHIVTLSCLSRGWGAPGAVNKPEKVIPYDPGMTV